MALKPSAIVGVVIALLLVGIMLPIGITQMQSVDLSQDVDIYQYDDQTADFSQNFTIGEGDKINVTLEFDDTYEVELNLTLNGVDVMSTYETTSPFTCACTITTDTGNYELSVKNRTTAPTGVSFNLTVNITSFGDADTIASMEVLIQQILPILAIVGLIVSFLAYTNKKR